MLLVVVESGFCIKEVRYVQTTSTVTTIFSTEETESIHYYCLWTASGEVSLSFWEIGKVG
jgi:hypothetical protein